MLYFQHFAGYIQTCVAVVLQSHSPKLKILAKIYNILVKTTGPIEPYSTVGKRMMPFRLETLRNVGDGSNIVIVFYGHH